MNTQSPIVSGRLQLGSPQVFYSEAPVIDPPTAPDPAPTVETSTEGGIFDDAALNAIFKFDPFEKGDESQPAPSGADSISAPAESAAPTAADSVSSPEPAPAPKGLDEVVASLSEVAASLKTKEETKDQPDPIESLFSDVQLPPTLVAAMRSESPEEAGAALNLIVQGTARMAVRKARELLDSFVTESLPVMLSSHAQAQTAAKDVHDDFYGTYPQLNKPEIKPFITNLAAQMANEAGANFKGWNPAFRDAVATKFLGMVKDFVPSQQAAPAPAPFIPPGSVRTPAPPADELFSFF